MNLKPGISVIVPVYNSAATLNDLIMQLGLVLPSLADKYEVILINDGSRDNSWETIQNICREQTWVQGVNMMRNYGQHNALLCGTRSARYKYVITMDDDLQHPPEELPKFVAKLEEGYDVVYGSPRKMPHSLLRNFSSRITKKVLALVMGIKTVREISAFRAFRTDLRRAFETYQSPGVILDVLLSWATTSFASIVVEENPREVGRSNYNFTKLVSQTFLILTGYSTVPLRLASWLGFATTIFGFLVLVYVLLLYFLQGSIPGFPFLASIISLFGGIQLFALGIIGEYLARVFDRSMDRPSYVIGEMVETAPIQPDVK